MPETKSLSISFGDFACDIVGYDNPFTILNQVVDLFAKVAEATAASAQDQDATSTSGDSFQIHLMRQAEAFDLKVEQREGRFIVSNPNAVSQTAPEDVAASDDPVAAEYVAATAETARPRLRLSPTLPADAAALNTLATEDVAAEEPPVKELPAHPLVESAASESATSEIEVEVVSEDPPVFEETLDAAEAKAVEEIAPVDAIETTAVEESAEPAAETAEHVLEQATDTLAAPAEALNVVSPLLVAEADAPAEDVEESIFVDDNDGEDAIAASGEDLDLENEIFASLSEQETAEDANYEDAKEVAEDETEEATLDLSAFANVEDKTEASHATAPEAQEATKDPEPRRVKPRIVINRDASRGHRRARVKAAENTGEGRGLLELTSALRAKPKSRPAAADLEDDHDNFLFADDDPAEVEAPKVEAVKPAALNTHMIEAPTAQPIETKPDAAETTASEPTKPARKGLSLGIFKRFTQREDESVETAELDEDAGFNRLKETADAALPRLEEPSAEAPRKVDAEPAIFAISGAADFEDEKSPAAFARRVGASSLQDLLESSAAFMSIVEGKAKFSRRDVMQALADIGVEKDYTQEARLKSFRKLLTNGAIVRSDDGLFSISHATRFGYETRLRG